MDSPSPDGAGDRASRRRRGRLAATGLLAAATVPPEWVEGGPVLCLFRGAAGVPCPGCGLTRSVVRFMHGDVQGSARAHPFGPAAALLLGSWAAEAITARPLRLADPDAWVEDARGRRLLAVVGAVWFAWAIARAVAARRKRKGA